MLKQSFAAEQPVRISDLCDGDKTKIAKLIQQVVTLEQEKQQLLSDSKERNDSYMARLGRLKKQNEDVIQETATLRAKFSQAVDLLQKYQGKAAIRSDGVDVGAHPASEVTVDDREHTVGMAADKVSQAPVPALLSSFEQLQRKHSQKMVVAENEALSKLRVQLEHQHAQNLKQQKKQMEKQHLSQQETNVSAVQKKADAKCEMALQTLRRQHQKEREEERERWQDELARKEMLQSDALESRLHHAVTVAVSKARQEER